jgi:hypothetical protein
MKTPSVTEISRRPEPVVHDTFIDDLAPRRVVTTRHQRPGPAGRSEFQR